jgi:hypothetical protein
MGHRVKLGSSENDFTGKFKAPWYGHKAGGATIYVKRRSTRKERRLATRELRQECIEIEAEAF